MEGKKKTSSGIALIILAFIIGLLGIVVLFVIGEGTNNGILAFAAVSIPFALLAGLFARFAPDYWPVLGVAMAAPVTFLGLAGSWSGAYMAPGALWTLALACGGAYVGARLRSP